MNDVNHRKIIWKSFVLGCLVGFSLTIILEMAGLVIGTQTLKFWIARNEATTLKTPHIQSLKHMDYSYIGTSLEGKKVPLSEYQGKPCFILVWHPECIHCLATLITVQSLYNSLKDMGIPVIAITQAQKEAIQKAEKELNISVPVLIVPNELIHFLCEGNVPCGLVVNSKGEIIYSQIGSINWGADEVVQFLINLSDK